MNTKQAAIEKATQTLLQLGIPEALPKLHAADVFIKRHILGGSHSVVTYPPLDSLFPISSQTFLDKLHFGKKLNLYIHIAFCETLCSFCHYSVKHYRGKQHSSEIKYQSVLQYLETLKKEMQFWGKKLKATGTSISSIYIGGGTPLVLEKNQLIELIKILRNEFDIIPNAEFCIEGSPLTMTAEDGEDKLRFLLNEGVNRLSFGIQSFDDTVLKFAARGYKRDTAIEACEIAAKVFDNWNVDLIQSLYHGNMDEIWENIIVLSALRPPHITWYHGRFANRPQGDWYQQEAKRVNFENDLATLTNRMLIWQQIESMGYLQIDGNRFVRNERYIDPFKKSRTSISSDLLGIGASSYSHFNSIDNFNSEGIFFRNASDIQNYINAVNNNSVAIDKGRLINTEEQLAASFVVGLRTGRFESENIKLLRAQNENLSKHYNQLEKKLKELSILEKFMAESNNHGTRLSKLGQLFEDEVLSLFYSPSVQKTLLPIVIS